MAGVLQRTHRVLRALELAWMLGAGAGMFAIMSIIVVDVAARYLLKAPLAWSFDLISLYLTPAIFFLALSDTLQRNHHINVDIVVLRLAPRAQNVLVFIGSVLAAVVFAAIACMAVVRTHEDFVQKATSSSIYEWPTWISVLFVVLGAGLLFLRLGFRVLAFAHALATGRPEAVGVEPPLPPEEDL
ncbi:MAG TPA: TRAP transporter small permease [Usitatibacter sp.]|nr:TRAP transporter small permease [Usitatibacter sp.]